MSESNEMVRPSISVVMPAYNHEKYVGEAVESVLSQSFQDLELVVIDDGSKDRTGEIVKSYAEKDPRVRYIFQENQDAFNSLNRGMRESKGEWLAIINSDDVFMPGRLQRLWDAKDELKADCLFTDVIPVDHESKEIPEGDHYWHQWHQKNREQFFTAGDLYTGFLHGNFMVTTSNLFFSRAAQEKTGFFSPLRYLHDYDFMFRMMLACPEGVHYLKDDKLLYYRIHGANTLREGAIKARLEDQKVIRKYTLESLPEALRLKAATGLDRLVALESELGEIRHSPVEALRQTGPVQKILSLLRR
ncbi:glycosyltransferase family 2 protein [Kiritimatiellaeota bacterium B1221]|nr:glycosyltransferase family 2 protein [Kiritimatiellaeota bacterium B1221]